MSLDYLWDGTGEPDPEIVRLETALRPLRRIPAAPRLDIAKASGKRGAWSALAAAAAVALALAPAVMRTPARPADDAWNVGWLRTTPGSMEIVRRDRLRVGQWIETHADRARIGVGTIGQVTLEPLTRVGRLDGGSRVHQLSLTRGTLHAMVWAPPGQFVVETRAARAIDLGCEYTLTVAEDGSGLLRVETGWVGFERGGVLSLVPAGARCPVRADRGPGTPRFETASAPFAGSLDALDAGASGDTAAAALEQALAEARSRDALSLWHLLARLDTTGRGRVYDRLAQFVPAPEGVTRDGIVRGDAAMRDAWWEELGFGSAEFWRAWTRPMESLANGANGSR